MDRQVADVLWRLETSNQVFEVYALLDGARDPRILPLLQRSGLFHRCLYSGKLPPEFLAAAPHLVLLSPAASFTRELLELGWGRSWGVFLRSLATLDQLHRHFRKFLRVEDEHGKPFFFRFYDPRVLRVFLPTCSAGQLAEFFGPVGRFLLEGEEARVVEDFYVVLEQLEHRRHPLSLPRPAAAELAAVPERRTGS